MPQIDFLIFCSLCTSILLIIFVLLTLVEKNIGHFCTKILKLRTKLYNSYNLGFLNIQLKKSFQKTKIKFSKLLNNY